MKNEDVVQPLPEDLSVECKEKLAQVGRLIAKARKNLGWSQNKLGEAADGCRPYISNIERGLANFTFTYIYDIGQALGLELEDIFCPTKVVVQFPDPFHARVHKKLQELIEDSPKDGQIVERFLDGFLVLPRPE